MPSPETRWGVNTPVYAWCNRLLRSTPGVCCVSPNAVTLLGLAIAAGVVHNLWYGGPWPALVALAFLREFMDILDGALARHCHASSRKGALLDVVCDFLYTLAVGAVVLRRLWVPRTALAWLVCVVAVAGMVSILVELVNEIRRRPKPSQESVVAQNSFLLVPALLVLVKGALVHRGGAGG